VLFFIFLFGLAIGSFLNVVINRGLRGETLRGRSHCESCGTVLSAKELIPLVSFVWQKARCRRCREKISWQYPLVELVTAFSFAAAAHYLDFPRHFDIKTALFALAAFSAIGAAIVIAVSDFRERIIPDGAVLILFLLGAASAFFRQSIGKDFLAAAAFALFLGSLWLVSRGRWIGFGDVKLMSTLALLVGFPSSLAAVLFSFWTGGIAGAILFALGLKSLKSEIPFGPFILAGSLLAFFFSEFFFSFAGLLPLL
jgi:leader peptidase (prepilin peptidase)/N-methyltransferase